MRLSVDVPDTIVVSTAYLAKLVGSDEVLRLVQQQGVAGVRIKGKKCKQSGKVDPDGTPICAHDERMKKQSNGRWRCEVHRRERHAQQSSADLGLTVEDMEREMANPFALTGEVPSV